MIKTGECYYRDEDNNLWRAESYVDDEGKVTTVTTKVEEE